MTYELISYSSDMPSELCKAQYFNFSVGTEQVRSYTGVYKQALIIPNKQVDPLYIIRVAYISHIVSIFLLQPPKPNCFLMYMWTFVHLQMHGKEI